MSKTKGVTTRIENFDPKDLRLLERNARFMRAEQFARLVENVKRDGKLTSVPFAVREPDGKYLVLSGNHRTRAAIEAGFTEIEVMVTDDEMTVDQRVAMQLSHNAINGQDDLAILKEIYESVKDLDWKGYSGLDDATLELLAEVDIAAIGEAGLEFQTLSMLFLPAEMERAKELLAKADEAVGRADEKWLAQYADHDRVMDSIATACLAHGVKNIATGFTALMDLCEAHVTDLADGWWSGSGPRGRDEHRDWAPIVTVTGYSAPKESLAVVKTAMERIIGRGDADGEWQALEFLASEYLAGS